MISKVEVYGSSDDLIEVESDGELREEFSVYDQLVRLEFSDGTELLVEYVDPGVWVIIPQSVPAGTRLLRQPSKGPDDLEYSDRVLLVGEINWVAMYKMDATIIPLTSH